MTHHVETWRLCNDLIEVFKILRGLDNVRYSFFYCIHHRIQEVMNISFKNHMLDWMSEKFFSVIE